MDAPRFHAGVQVSVFCQTPASGLASAIRVFAILRDGHAIEDKQGWTRRADAQPLAGSTQSIVELTADNHSQVPAVNYCKSYNSSRFNGSCRLPAEMKPRRFFSIS
jgi:hypothetical protein